MPFGTGTRHLLREFLIWTAVLGAGFAGVYHFESLRAFFADRTREAVETYGAPRPAQKSASSGFERSVTLTAGRNGHFYARAEINGRPVAVLVDTGASSVLLSHDDASSVGVEPHPSDYTIRTRTANGTGRAAPVQIDHVRIGDIEVRDVRGIVAEPGALDVTLLGMDFIGRLGRFELRGRELLLVE